MKKKVVAWLIVVGVLLCGCGNIAEDELFRGMEESNIERELTGGLEHTEIAGQPVSIGTYDNHTYWDYVSFCENNQGVVAFTYQVEDWWEEYGNQALEILDSLSFAWDIKESDANSTSK